MVDQIRRDLLGMFSDLRFDEVRHMYFVNGENYLSVSKKLEQHYEKFDRELWLSRCAPKEGLTEQELGKRWDNKRDEACDRGHDTHSFLEHFRPGKEYLADAPQKQAGLKFLRDYIYCENPRYVVLLQEVRMIHRLFKYCGTADLLLWDTWTNTIIIVDYKTNEDLFKTYGYLKAPFENYGCNPFNKYQLQFTYYQLMLEQSKYKVSERWLIYLNMDETYSVYKTSDMTKDLSKFLTNPTQYSEPTPASYGMVW